MIHWQEVFSKDGLPWQGADSLSGPVAISSLDSLVAFLNAIHIRFCLVKPFQENKNYPFVEARELLPSFDNDMFEYKNLPGFALVAFARQLDYFSEIFQFEKLHAATDDSLDAGISNEALQERNLQTIASRLPRIHQDVFRQQFADINTVQMENYPQLLPYLLNMDRAHVLCQDSDRLFHLGGVFASFPSDIDSELKRFGVRIGKFAYGDSDLYEQNRMFVYQFLMELYGFPIVSERRTSAALFARKLHKMGEHFLLRVMGQSDRTLTTYISDGSDQRYPRLDKIALVSVDPDQEEALETIGNKGFFLDKTRRVVIMRVTYRQHRFDQSNVRQDRALSVVSQEILHPLTGEALGGLNIIKNASNMFLRLNDIVRGEYVGRTVYKRTEIVENTDTDEKRLKVLFAWLSKHARRIISYSDEFYANVSKVVDGYLFSADNADVFDSLRELYNEVCNRFSYIKQARQVRILADICQRTLRGRRLTYLQMLQDAVEILTALQFEIVKFFPDLVDDIINTVEKILQDRYLRRKYLDVPENTLSKSGLEIRKHYGRLVSLQDGFLAVRKARLKSLPEKQEKAVSA